MGYPKLTMTECVVVALCIVGAAVLLVPYILNSRGKARSATCQYHEMKLILANPRIEGAIRIDRTLNMAATVGR